LPKGRFVVKNCFRCRLPWGYRSPNRLALVAISLLLPASTAFPQPQPSDFQYLGAFAITGERSVDPNPYAYGQRGLALDPSDGGLWITGHDHKAQVFKVAIPAPSMSKEWNDLPVAPVLVAPKDFMASCPSDDEWHFGAIEFFNGRLDGICKYWYNVSGEDLDTFHRGSASGTATEGPFHVGSGKRRFHSARMGAYLFTVPKEWAEEVGLGSKQMVTGFARSQGAFGGSQGPTMIAFDAENPSDAQDLVWYRTKYPTCPSKGCDYPDYTSCDSWESATWVSTARGHGILVAGSKGLGPTRYGTGEPGDCSSYKGYHCDPLEIQIIFYDPEEIAAVLRGKGKPWDLRPYAVWRPSDLWSETCASVGGLAFDAKNQRLYLVEKSAGPSGRAVVHTYGVGETPAR